MAIERRGGVAGAADRATSVLRLGVFGGTFDPIHVGHLIIAEEARARVGLDRVLFVPTLIPPHKSQRPLATSEDRYRMVQVAIEDNPGFAVSNIELNRHGPSFTVDTLHTIRAEYGPEVELYFVMGTDSLYGLKTWHRRQEILRLARIIAVTRPGFDVDWSALEAQMPGISRVTELLETTCLGVSSTDIRARLRRGFPIRYQVPATVEAYIREHHLYT